MSQTPIFDQLAREFAVDRGKRHIMDSFRPLAPVTIQHPEPVESKKMVVALQERYNNEKASQDDTVALSKEEIRKAIEPRETVAYSHPTDEMVGQEVVIELTNPDGSKRLEKALITEQDPGWTSIDEFSLNQTMTLSELSKVSPMHARAVERHVKEHNENISVNELNIDAIKQAADEAVHRDMVNSLLYGDKTAEEKKAEHLRLVREMREKGMHLADIPRAFAKTEDVEMRRDISPDELISTGSTGAFMTGLIEDTKDQFHQKYPGATITRISVRSSVELLGGQRLLVEGVAPVPEISVEDAEEPKKAGGKRRRVRNRRKQQETETVHAGSDPMLLLAMDQAAQQTE
jgi:hypothetical protein